MSDKIGKSLFWLFRRFYVGWNVRASAYLDAAAPIDPAMLPIDLSDAKKFGRAQV